MNLSPEFLEKQKAILLKEKETVEAEIKNLKKYPDYGTLGDDNVQEIVDFENNISADDQLERVLTKVNASLLAIEAGAYGKCKSCNQMIEQGRLKIIPYADLCITCQQQKKD